MNKKLLFSLVVALLVGLIFGGVTHNLFFLSNDSSEQNGKNKTTSLRRFGDAVTVKPVSERLSGKTKAGSLSKADSYLLDITKMDTEEILSEINRLIQKIKSERDAMDYLALDFLYSRLGEKAPRQALAYIKQNPGVQHYENQVLKAWVRKNPEAAMAYCLEDKDAENIPEKAGIIAKVSPEKALEWLKQFTDDTKVVAQYGIFSAFFQSYPDKIEELLQKAGTQIELDWRMKRFIAREWIVADKTAAMKWINALPEADLMETRASALGALPLEEATQELIDLEGKAKEAALIEIGISLGYNSPLQSLELLMNNTGDDLESWGNILNGVYTIGSKANDPALSAYLEKLPSGEKKDLLVAKIMDRNSYSDDDLQETTKVAVLALASQIENPQKRESAVEKVLNAWMIRSPEEARQWIEQSDFSPERKRVLSRRCNKFIKPD